jgi:hexosaminidase
MARHSCPSWPRLAALALAALLAACSGPDPQTPSAALATTSLEMIVPRPVSVTATGGTFSLSAETRIVVQPGSQEARAIGEYLAGRLRPATGLDLQVTNAAEAPTAGIFLTLNADPDEELGEEGYELIVLPELVSVRANAPAGLFYGAQTLRQLLPAAIEGPTVQPGPWSVATGTIRDYPRFAWRGAMLDVARHFFSVSDVTRYVDLLAAYKINRLHLHLADDQGWRIEIRSWPNLALYGGSLEVGGTPGGYYSQNDYAYLVAYAQSRYMTIVPEIDMPGHTNAALASYPELDCSGSTPELYTAIEVGFSSLCIGSEVTYAFVEDVIGELAAITPGPYLHVGGDEAQATSPADYVSFMNRVGAIVEAAGKQMVGWEEIAQAGIPGSSIVQHWNPGDGLALEASVAGLRVIMSPADKAYLDMKYVASTPLGLNWAGFITVPTAYNWDPAALVADVTDRHILGVEAPLWSETLETLDDVEYMAFPRILGYAEIGWTLQSRRSWEEYRLRLAAQGPRLKLLEVNFYRSPDVPWP